jgi:hypothetical protein
MKHCNHCGDAFTAHGNQRYCTKSCKRDRRIAAHTMLPSTIARNNASREQTALRQATPRACIQCGTTYTGPLQRKRCISCAAAPHKPCVDCGVDIKLANTRCRPCHATRTRTTLACGACGVAIPYFNDWNRTYQRNQLRCDECKRSALIPRMIAALRRALVVAVRNERRAVSDAKAQAKALPHPCRDCGVDVHGHKRRLRCVPCAEKAKQANNRKANKARRAKHGKDRSHIKRARKYGVPYENGVTLLRALRELGNRCGVCRCVVRRSDKAVPKQATLGHIVALSVGGSHTWDNVQVECRACNTKKHTRPLGQLRIGLTHA